MMKYKFFIYFIYFLRKIQCIDYNLIVLCPGKSGCKFLWTAGLTQMTKPTLRVGVACRRLIEQKKQAGIWSRS